MNAYCFKFAAHLCRFKFDDHELAIVFILYRTGVSTRKSFNSTGTGRMSIFISQNNNDSKQDRCPDERRWPTHIPEHFVQYRTRESLFRKYGTGVYVFVRVVVTPPV